MTDLDKLRAFAQDVLAGHGAAEDIDAADLQDLAAKHGLLAPTEMRERCGETCYCAEVGAEFPTTCYRRTPLLTRVPR